MKIIPAIDLRDGKVVRLFRGLKEKQTTYSDDPVRIAMDFCELGAKRIHIVNLNGAFGEEDSENLKKIYDIRKKINAFLEVGGGIRSFKIAKKYFDTGIDAVILTTLFFLDKKEFERIIKVFYQKIIAGADVKGATICIKGWQENSDFKIKDFLKEMGEYGINEAIITQISKDGTLAGVDADFYRDIVSSAGMSIIASGGVSSLRDIENLFRTGVKGIVIGKAIYEKRINLKEAIEKYGNSE
ncbi:MAG: 1-(5-phosphoribosyl)-5-[(5-phosphoribosylamino)methylideneamino]imidazole-4-carboxamide isomerase [Elusimicrobia bacterium]|nr:1-(5-phosphoribosyl)-5-[(5-phosphoribosylamino)methylideneamino]imidazole-4-carboxamide isomerase [Elusimicrobiota bacterium]